MRYTETIGLAGAALLLLGLITLSGCPASQDSSAGSTAAEQGVDAAASSQEAGQKTEVVMVSDVLHAKGMHCSACEMAIETSLSSLPGVVSVKADFQSTEVAVEYDATKSSYDEVVAAVEKLGYTVDEVESVTGEAEEAVDADAEGGSGSATEDGSGK